MLITGECPGRSFSFTIDHNLFREDKLTYQANSPKKREVTDVFRILTLDFGAHRLMTGKKGK